MTAPTSNITRSRWPLWAAAGCLLLLACAVVAAAAAGLLVLSQRRPAQAGPPNVEYVLDASPRMLQETDGATRLSVAQGVLAEIVRPASPTVDAGLRVFGTGQLPGPCQDTNLLVPLAAANQQQIAVKLADLQAGAGVDSALGVAMVAAIRDLAATKGPHSLVVVTGGADSCNAQADQLIAQEAQRQHIQLQVFVVGYQVADADSTALQGVVDQTSGAQYIKANTPDELRRSLQAIQAYVDAPGTVTVANVVATAGAGSAATAVGGTPSPAVVTPQNTGALQLSVLAFAGQPAETGDRLQVYVYSPQDHQAVLTTNFDNPTTLRLPAGQYDLLLAYGVSPSSPFIGGNVQQWLTGVKVSANLTTTQTYDFKLGQVALTVLEAPGKPVPDGNYLFNFRIYNPSDFSHYVASVLVTSTAALQLAPGTYQVTADYPLTQLVRQDQSTQTFAVKAGQSLDYSIDLKLGHIRVEVDDDLGQPIDAGRMDAAAFTLTEPNTAFADSYGANPADVALQAGVAYNLVIKLDTGQRLTLSNQTVREGDVQTIKVNERDFK